MALFLLGLLASVPLAILANLLTPRVSTALAKRNTSRRQARIEKIHSQAELVEAYRDSPSLAVAAFARRLGFCVSEWAAAVLLNVGSALFLMNPHDLGAAVNVWIWMGFVVLVLAEHDVLGVVLLSKKITDAEWYAERTARQLRRLGESPQPEAATAASAEVS
jgi:hypothetical protein